MAFYHHRDMSKDPGYAEGRSVDEEPKGVFVKKKVCMGACIDASCATPFL
jgi:hypothetical protein